jgi:hypothetical protein
VIDVICTYKKCPLGHAEDNPKCATEVKRCGAHPLEYLPGRLWGCPWVPYGTWLCLSLLDGASGCWPGVGRNPKTYSVRSLLPRLSANSSRRLLLRTLGTEVQVGLRIHEEGNVPCASSAARRLDNSIRAPLHPALRRSRGRSKWQICLRPCGKAYPKIFSRASVNFSPMHLFVTSSALLFRRSLVESEAARCPGTGQPSSPDKAKKQTDVL